MIILLKRINKMENSIIIDGCLMVDNYYEKEFSTGDAIFVLLMVAIFACTFFYNYNSDEEIPDCTNSHWC